MKLTSTAFQAGGKIPQQFTCEGQDVSPDLSWSEAPKETKSFALVVHDPDAPRVDGFVHWVLYNIPASTNHIAQNVPKNGSIPELGLQGRNDSGKIGYIGPCPPSGTHRYFFRLYALRSSLSLGPDATYKEVMSGMEGTIIEQAELMGTYAKVTEKVA